MKFEHLCDDVLRQIFKYHSLKERTRFELVNSRFRTIALAINENVLFDDIYCSRRTRLHNQKNYLTILKKSRSNILDLTSVDTNSLFCQVFGGQLTVAAFVQELIESCPNCRTLILNVSEDNLCELALASAFARQLGANNQIRSISVEFSFWTPLNVFKATSQFKEFYELCPGAREVKVTVSNNSNMNWLEGGVAPNSSSVSTWAGFSEKIERLELIYINYPVSWFGVYRWSGYHYANMRTLIIRRKMTSLCIESLIENAPNLERLDIEVDRFKVISVLDKLKGLKELSMKALEVEGDLDRFENKIHFDRFLSKSGNHLKSLSLEISVQNFNFFENVTKFCRLDRLNLVIRGSCLGHGFGIQDILLLRTLRTLVLECPLALGEVSSILSACAKLKAFTFCTFIHDANLVRKLKLLSIDFANRHPRRDICITMTHGSNCDKLRDNFLIENYGKLRLEIVRNRSAHF